MNHDDQKADQTAQILALALIASIAFLISFGVMQSRQENHDRAATDTELACLIDDHPLGFDYDDCLEQTPSWAAHPGWYSLGIALVVLVIGRLYIFMRRLESRS